MQLFNQIPKSWKSSGLAENIRIFFSLREMRPSIAIMHSDFSVTSVSARKSKSRLSRMFVKVIAAAQYPLIPI
jgi:hypothetical protein